MSFFLFWSKKKKKLAHCSWPYPSSLHMVFISVRTFSLISRSAFPSNERTQSVQSSTHFMWENAEGQLKAWHFSSVKKIEWRKTLAWYFLLSMSTLCIFFPFAQQFMTWYIRGNSAHYAASHHKRELQKCTRWVSFSHRWCSPSSCTWYHFEWAWCTSCTQVPDPCLKKAGKPLCNHLDLKGGDPSGSFPLSLCGSMSSVPQDSAAPISIHYMDVFWKALPSHLLSSTQFQSWNISEPSSENEGGAGQRDSTGSNALLETPVFPSVTSNNEQDDVWGKSHDFIIWQDSIYLDIIFYGFLHYLRSLVLKW